MIAVGIVAAALALQAPATTTDPYNVGGWINRYRATVGLHALAYDHNISGYCASNNAHQSSRGLGHYVNPPGYLGACSGLGYANGQAAVMGWWHSAPHRVILMNRAARYYGVAWDGRFWSLNIR